MLSSLIAAPAPTKPLRPLHPPASEEALEKRAAKALHAQKHEREERGHVKDVIAGWTARPNLPFSQWHGVDTYEDGEDKANVEHAAGGAEKEKELRRLAQRGVVRLFNAIKAAQYTEEAATANPAIATSTSASRAIKDASPAPSATGSIAAGPVSRAGNLLGSRGRQEARKQLTHQFRSTGRDISLLTVSRPAINSREPLKGIFPGPLQERCCTQEASCLDICLFVRLV
jgi:hypothetical protein